MKNIHYSVPDTLEGKTVQVKMYSEKIVIFHQGGKVAAHERVYGVADWKIRLEHYARTLLRKPGAIAGSLAVQQMPAKIQELFHKHFQNNGRYFVLLILYASENGFTDKDIIRSYEALRMRGVHKVSADQIKASVFYLVCLPGILRYKFTFLHMILSFICSMHGAMNILLDLTQMMENKTVLNKVNHLN